MTNVVRDQPRGECFCSVSEFDRSRSRLPWRRLFASLEIKLNLKTKSIFGSKSVNKFQNVKHLCILLIQTDSNIRSYLDHNFPSCDNSWTAAAYIYRSRDVLRLLYFCNSGNMRRRWIYWKLLSRCRVVIATHVRSATDVPGSQVADANHNNKTITDNI